MINPDDMANLPAGMPWSEETNCAVTVCDSDGIILYMNRKSRETFASHGDLIGKNLFDCHSPESSAKIRHMLATGESNANCLPDPLAQGWRHSRNGGNLNGRPRGDAPLYPLTP